VLETFIGCNALAGTVEDIVKINSVFLDAVKIKYAAVLLLFEIVLLM
jgi:hypothetical protein